MLLVDQLIAVATTFHEARKLSLSRVSGLVFQDGNKLKHIVNGKADLTTTRFENAMLWFSQNWPDGLEWPANISKPSSSRSPTKRARRTTIDRPTA